MKFLSSLSHFPASFELMCHNNINSTATLERSEPPLYCIYIYVYVLYICIYMYVYTVYCAYMYCIYIYNTFIYIYMYVYREVIYCMLLFEHHHLLIWFNFISYQYYLRLNLFIISIWSRLSSPHLITISSVPVQTKPSTGHDGSCNRHQMH